MERQATVTLVWNEVPPPGGASEFVASFRARIGSEHVGVVHLLLPYSVKNPVYQALGVESAAEARLMLAAYALSRIETDPGIWAQLDEQTNNEPLAITLDDSSAAELAAGFSVKECDRQVRLEQDRWCTAPSAMDDAATITIDGRRSAPTSMPVCSGCNVPDSRIRCSAFMHPSVRSVRSVADRYDRSLDFALCDAGYQKRLFEHPDQCIPDIGHDCWHKVIAVGARDPETLLDPLTLPDTLDRLNDVWRLAFRSHLVVLNSTLDAAGLALDAGSREHFMERIRALSEILDALTVDATLTPSDTPAQFRKGSLNRLETVLRARSKDENGPTIAEAVEVLRRVRRVDNALQHPTGDVALRFSQFGVAYPPSDWQHAWQVLRAAVVSALRRLILMTRQIAANETQESWSVETD